MPDDVSMGEPGSNGGKLFGLPTPLVLIGGGILGVLAVVSLSKKGSGSGMVPMSTAVQLGDIQQRQLEIEQNLSTNFAGASAERAAYNQNVLQALAASETAVKDQLDALNQSVNGNFAALTEAQKAHQNDLLARLAQIQAQQKDYFTSLQGDITQVGNRVDYTQQRQEVWGNYLNYYLSLISGKIDQLPQGGPLPPESFNSWDQWYQGWRSMFGRTGPGNPFDLNKDNIVDIRDYALGREAWKVQ